MYATLSASSSRPWAFVGSGVEWVVGVGGVGVQFVAREGELEHEGEGEELGSKGASSASTSTSPELESRDRARRWCSCIPGRTRSNIRASICVWVGYPFPCSVSEHHVRTISEHSPHLDFHSGFAYSFPLLPVLFFPFTCRLSDTMYVSKQINRRYCFEKVHISRGA
jgi:hypothetical protein